MLDRETAKFIERCALRVKSLQDVQFLTQISNSRPDLRESQARIILEELKELKKQADIYSKKDLASLKNTVEALNTSEQIFLSFIPKTAPTLRK
jgi:hypothetical protein